MKEIGRFEWKILEFRVEILQNYFMIDILQHETRPSDEKEQGNEPL